jgi:quinol monooxygenase YgiN
MMVWQRTTRAPNTPGGIMIAIIGHIDVDPSVRDRLVESTIELQLATRRDEPGCVVYTVAADPAVPGRISITELWESSAALDDHFQHANFFATGDLMRTQTRLGGTAMKYRIDAVAPVRGSDGNATSSFI